MNPNKTTTIGQRCGVVASCSSITGISADACAVTSGVLKHYQHNIGRQTCRVKPYITDG